MSPRRFSLLLALALPIGLAGQTVPADAGTLLIRRHGALVAEEEFQIRRDGAAMTLTSTARWAGSSTVVLAVYTPRRVTVRLSGSAGEIAREFPTGGTLILDDSAFVFLLMLPHHSAGTIRVARPRSAQRVPAMLADGGLTGPATRQERAVTITLDTGTVRAWFDADGRFLRAEIPSRNLEIARLPQP